MTRRSLTLDTARTALAAVLLVPAVVGCSHDDEPSRAELCSMAKIRYLIGEDTDRTLIDTYCDD